MGLRGQVFDLLGGGARNRPTGQNQCFNALLFFFRYACDE